MSRPGGASSHEICQCSTSFHGEHDFFTHALMKTKIQILLVACGCCVLAASRVDAASTIEFTNRTSVTVLENAAEVVFSVRRTGDVDTMVSVDYVTIDGSALAGSDYQATAGTLTFGANQTNLT